MCCCLLFRCFDGSTTRHDTRRTANHLPPITHTPTGRAIFRVAETFGIGETNTPALANAVLKSASVTIRVNRVGIDCTGFTLDLNGISKAETRPPTAADGNVMNESAMGLDGLENPAAREEGADSDGDGDRTVPETQEAEATFRSGSLVADARDEKILHEEKPFSAVTIATSATSGVGVGSDVSAATALSQRVLLPNTTATQDPSHMAELANHPCYSHAGRRGAIRQNNVLSRLMLAKKILAERGKSI